MKYLILGNGVAGISAALSIREHDPQGEIKVITKSPMPYYYRIRLIEYLAGSTPIEKLIAFGEAYYDDKEIQVILDREAVRIDHQRREVHFIDGGTERYDRLLLATGARPRYPDIEGIDKEGILKFRGATDSDEITNYVEVSKRVAVLGGGVLGIETANSLIKLGKDATVIEASSRLLPRQLDAEGSKLLQKALEGKGMKFILGEEVKKILGDEKVSGVEFKDGTSLPAESIVLSAGIIPRLELCESAGVATNMGIIVDEHMETSVKGIYAAGDVAEFRGGLYGLWIPSKEQGEIAGTNMSGRPKRYNPTLSEVRLKVTGISFFSGGNIEERGANIYRYNRDGIYRKFFVREGRIVGAILIGDGKTSMKASAFIKNGESPDVLYGLYE